MFQCTVCLVSKHAITMRRGIADSCGRAERPRVERLTSCWSRLAFDGDERHYALWETKCLSRLHFLRIKDPILRDESSNEDEDNDKVEAAPIDNEKTNAAADVELSTVLS